MQIDIPDEDVRYLNEPAKHVFVKSIESHSEELLAEANRLEAAGKSTGGDPEITSTNISDAALLVRRGYKKPKKSALAVFTQVVAALTTFLTGLIFDFERMKQPVPLIIFLILLAIAITTTVLAIVKDWN